jgi:hypothetical protein
LKVEINFNFGSYYFNTTPKQIERYQFYKKKRTTRRTLIALMMEAASTSEMSVKFYQTTRPNNPEDSHLHSRRCENLKSALEL